MRTLSLIIVFTFALAIAVHSHLYTRHHEESTFFSQMLYLPSGKYLKAVSFGYHGPMADFIYLWSIQYYGDPGFHPRMEYLKHTYDLITDLDPQFLDAYQTGALFMFYEGRNPEAGLKLLDKGFSNNPTEWILPTDAGFYCMMTLKDNRRAANYFEKASRVADAPTFVKRLLSGMEFRLGDRRKSYELWKEVYEKAERPSIKQTAFQHVHDLHVMIDLEELDKAIQNYRRSRDRYPVNLQQLVSAGYFTSVPLDPEEEAYEYDPRIGKVKYSKEFILYKKYE